VVDEAVVVVGGMDNSNNISSSNLLGKHHHLDLVLERFDNRLYLVLEDAPAVEMVVVAEEDRVVEEDRVEDLPNDVIIVVDTN
jgi:hypothetical protein